ncbi:MAG: C40 family peptidase [Saprospiraceae bacterium]
MNITKLSIWLFGIILLFSSCAVFNGHKKEKTAVHSESKMAQTVITIAKEKMGSPYKFGGKTRAGYDCSGLIYSTFEEVGIKLPRTSIEQASVGKEIAYDKVRPGDLVFFATKKSDNKISHVGLVTEIIDPGEILFIHAANTGVKEDNLRADYYRRTFITARRTF